MMPVVAVAVIAGLFAEKSLLLHPIAPPPTERGENLLL